MNGVCGCCAGAGHHGIGFVCLRCSGSGEEPYTPGLQPAPPAFLGDLPPHIAAAPLVHPRPWKAAVADAGWRAGWDAAWPGTPDIVYSDGSTFADRLSARLDALLPAEAARPE